MPYCLVCTTCSSNTRYRADPVALAPVFVETGPTIRSRPVSRTKLRWVNAGRADIRARKTSTAHTSFAKRYDELVAEHCEPDANRIREFNRALEILERTCECGNDKMLLPGGKLGNTCQECQDLDAPQRRRSRRV